MLHFLSFMLWLFTHPLLGVCTIDGKEVPCSVFWAKIGWIFILVFLIAAFFSILWIWMLVDCLKRKTLKGEPFTDKVLWALVILLVNWLGAVIYYFCVKKKGD